MLAVLSPLQLFKRVEDGFGPQVRRLSLTGLHFRDEGLTDTGKPCKLLLAQSYNTAAF